MTCNEAADVKWNTSPGNATLDGSIRRSIKQLLSKHEGATLAADSEPTSESPVYNLDSPENQSAASLLNPAAGCSSDPVL